jgi:IMP cyclohydrolase
LYVGRIVAVGKTLAGANAALYRVSSRSFPNRQAVALDGTVAVVPRPGSEADVARNPYIAYDALRLAGEWAVVANGSQTDAIAERIVVGTPVRDALALVMLALDYEKDDYDTPRIAGAVPLRGDSGWLAVVRRDALVVKEVPLAAGRALYIATYEADDVHDSQSCDFSAATAAEAARFIVDGGVFEGLERPVTSAAAVAGGEAFDLATHVVQGDG